jgi:hypothetical protein
MGRKGRQVKVRATIGQALLYLFGFRRTSPKSPAYKRFTLDNQISGTILYCKL